MIDTPTPDAAGDSPDAEEPTVSAAVTVASARAHVYGLLAATFDGETETLAAALEERSFGALADVLPVDIDTASLDGATRDPETLAIGYDNLFVVPGPHYVPPFASAHADDPSEEFESDSPYHAEGEMGELLGEPAAVSARLYAAADFEPERGDGIPDHVAALFEFMRALCEREATLLAADEPDSDALDAVRELQSQTRSQLGWLDDFEEAVATVDSAEGVFATLSRIARTFAAWDATREPIDGA